MEFELAWIVWLNSAPFECSLQTVAESQRVIIAFVATFAEKMDLFAARFESLPATPVAPRAPPSCGARAQRLLSATSPACRAAPPHRLVVVLFGAEWPLAAFPGWIMLPRLCSLSNVFQDPNPVGTPNIVFIIRAMDDTVIRALFLLMVASALRQ
ncbi:hypothetical protein GWK47_044520 [Chionoecetes opilio]|uniref:Uncharacterized protein n=1 Tax=Chionoecetes opilio TaxID=41210 RepID=A0A8J4YJ41_CHIOP|nr:hypothetical protein GWK47_044520 [Chionoecetes opilio]